jgi:hypothetical protein
VLADLLETNTPQPSPKPPRHLPAPNAVDMKRGSQASTSSPATNRKSKTSGWEDDGGLLQTLTETCFHAYFGGGSQSSSRALTAAHVCKLFQEGETANIGATKLELNLHKAALHAFRLAVKLAIDKAVLGDVDVSDQEELLQTLRDSSTSLFVGVETTPDWVRAIQCNKSVLFSIQPDPKDKTVVQSHLLTKQDVCVRLGRLNSTAVCGQWASLQLELLYMTNDDEERYSIQAHPVMLRNLTVQSAEPLLGYPIFSSRRAPLPLSLLV